MSGPSTPQMARALATKAGRVRGVDFVGQITAVANGMSFRVHTEGGGILEVQVTEYKGPIG